MAGLMVGCLMEASCCLLVSYMPLAHFALTKKQAANAIKQQCELILWCLRQ